MDWSNIIGAGIGALVAVMLAATPWVLMVHAKLAVLNYQVGEMKKKIDKWEETAPKCALHDAAILAIRADVDRHQKWLEEMKEKE